MVCPRCKTAMRGEILTGRQVNGHSSNIRISGMTCWKCGEWIDVDVPTVSHLNIADIKQAKNQAYVGGRKPGQGPPPGLALQAAKDYFEVIANKRRGRMSWQAITDYICSEVGQQFSYLSLQKHYEQEALRRLDERAIEKKVTRSARRLKKVVAA